LLVKGRLPVSRSPRECFKILAGGPSSSFRARSSAASRLALGPSAAVFWFPVRLQLGSDRGQVGLIRRLLGAGAWLPSSPGPSARRTRDRGHPRSWRSGRALVAPISRRVEFHAFPGLRIETQGTPFRARLRSHISGISESRPGAPRHSVPNSYPICHGGYRNCLGTRQIRRCYT
jgi:hypothetical protein